uniref:Kinesin motor domain-containing protein n=1 Tax=Macrostomum lignano TaxID=282301 RepID=A0A1I8F2Z2_9PLAT
PLAAPPNFSRADACESPASVAKILALSPSPSPSATPKRDTSLAFKSVSKPSPPSPACVRTSADSSTSSRPSGVARRRAARRTGSCCSDSAVLIRTPDRARYEQCRERLAEPAAPLMAAAKAVAAITAEAARRRSDLTTLEQPRFDPRLKRRLSVVKQLPPLQAACPNGGPRGRFAAQADSERTCDGPFGQPGS